MAQRTIKRPVLKGTALVERQVHALLALSPAYGQLTPDKQRQIASNMVKIGGYLVEPENLVANQLPGAIAIVPVGEVAGNFLDAVNFPAFVASLVNGVFQAIVDSSIRQMEAYAELLSKVARTVDQFAEENINDHAARDWLATTYPDYLERDTESGDLRLVPGFDHALAIKRFRLLPLLCPLRKLGRAQIEDVLVPAARRRLAAERQQLLATMVLMGATR